MRAKVHFQTLLKDNHADEKEQKVIRMLPKQTLMDLLHEIRSPVVIAHPLLHDLSTEVPRFIYRLCSEAIKPIRVQENEVSFARGDACLRVLFVERGLLQYAQTVIAKT